jgi:hypothetical protein
MMHVSERAMERLSLPSPRPSKRGMQPVWPPRNHACFGGIHAVVSPLLLSIMGSLDHSLKNMVARKQNGHISNMIDTRCKFYVCLVIDIIPISNTMSPYLSLPSQWFLVKRSYLTNRLHCTCSVTKVLISDKFWDQWCIFLILEAIVRMLPFEHE